jgi:hypothetical protein
LEKIKDGLASNYRLVADIDLADGDWTPIAGVFTGTLWGDGHAIKNMLINTSTTKAGLFADLGTNAHIEGINIVGGSITSSAANAQVGAIAGYISGSYVTITQCSNTASITATGATAQVGGLVGSIKGAFATISYSFNKGNVTGGIYTGGIVGRAADGQNSVSISNCYSQATISTAVASAYAGGITGYMYSGRGTYTVENCYAAGSVLNTGNGAAAGIVGRAWNNAGTIIQHNAALQDALTGSEANTVAILGNEVNTGTKENYSNSEMLLNSVKKTDTGAKNGAGVTLAAAKTQTVYTTAPLTWNFTDIWAIDEGDYPRFQWETASVPNGIESTPVVNSTLKASAINGVLTVKGLSAGEVVRVYTIAGQTVATQIATSEEAIISVPNQGIYIVAAGSKTVKVVAGTHYFQSTKH